MTKTKAKREPTYLLDCVLPPADVTADGFLAKHNISPDAGVVSPTPAAITASHLQPRRDSTPAQGGVQSARLGLLASLSDPLAYITRDSRVAGDLRAENLRGTAPDGSRCRLESWDIGCTAD